MHQPWREVNRTRYARNGTLRIAYELRGTMHRRRPWLVLIQGMGLDGFADAVAAFLLAGEQTPKQPAAAIANAGGLSGRGGCLVASPSTSARARLFHLHLDGI